MNLANPKYVENVECYEMSKNDIIKMLQSKTPKQMINICVRKNGVGLAAIQVGIPKKFFVAFRPKNEEKEKNEWCIFFNANYTVVENAEIYEVDEGCLTYGGMSNSHKVKRYKIINASWDEIDDKGNMFRKEETLDGLFSQIFQHECDHLKNITIAKIGKKV